MMKSARNSTFIISQRKKYNLINAGGQKYIGFIHEAHNERINIRRFNEKAA